MRFLDTHFNNKKKKGRDQMSKFIKIFTNIDWNEVEAGTIVRYICSILVAINQLLTVFEKNPIPYSETAIYTVVSAILSIVVLIVNTYKNNPTSKEAIVTNKAMKALKNSSEEGPINIVRQNADGVWEIVDTVSTSSSEIQTGSTNSLLKESTEESVEK